MVTWGLTKYIIGDEFKDRLNTSISKKMNVVGWKYPPLDWMKLNIDGCSKGNLGLATVGGLIRDCMGFWIKGFTINMRSCTSISSELCTLITRL